MKSGKLKGDILNKATLESSKLPILKENNSCNFYGYDVENLMKETSELRKIITKRGTLEILMPLCCSTDPVRYLTFRKSMKGFSSKTLTITIKGVGKKWYLKQTIL